MLKEVSLFTITAGANGPIAGLFPFGTVFVDHAHILHFLEGFADRSFGDGLLAICHRTDRYA
jgi:hypothetical protein